MIEDEEENNRCLLYGRVSTNKQENSLDIQDSRCVDYAEYQKLHVIRTITDEDISGSTPIGERPGGSVVMDLLTRGFHDDNLPLCIPPVPIRHLVVSKLDRLGRNARDLLKFWDWCQAHGVIIHIIDMGVQSDKLMGKFMYQMTAIFAEFERDKILERVNSTIAKKFKAGESIGNLPYGFDKVLGEDGKTNTIEDNAFEQSWIRQMAEWQLQRKSTNQIAIELNLQGVPTKRGAVWTGGKVWRVLNSKHTKERVLKTVPTEPPEANTPYPPTNPTAPQALARPTFGREVELRHYD